MMKKAPSYPRKVNYDLLDAALSQYGAEVLESPAPEGATPQVAAAV